MNKLACKRFATRGCGEMADALALGASVHDVGVQVPSSAPQKRKVRFVLSFFVVVIK